MATTGWQLYTPAGFYKATVDGMDGADGLSTIIGMRGFMLTTIIMPSTWTSAALTFLLSADDSTYNSHYDISGEVSYSNAIAIASVSLGVKPELAMQLQGSLKLRSGTKAAAVQQGASRTITLIAWKLEQ